MDAKKSPDESWQNPASNLTALEETLAGSAPLFRRLHSGVKSIQRALSICAFRDSTRFSARQKQSLFRARAVAGIGNQPT